jgi:PTH1 family peptidyl-tRNA hydrolase
MIGLGNPGPRYADTRHNAGFWAIDHLCRRQGVALRHNQGFQAELGSFNSADGKLWLAKPLTFMNRSGQPAAALTRYYRIPPEAILVFHDDLDLPPGEVRVKCGGGHGGHNGLRDLDRALGSRQYHRVRLGIGHPGHKDAVVDYVLTRPSQQDREAIEHAIERVEAVLPELLRGDWARVMNTLHRKP